MTDSDDNSPMKRLMELTERAQALSTKVQSHAASTATGQEFAVADAATVGNAFARAWLSMAEHPEDILKFQNEMATKVADAWTRGWLGESEPPKDRRFRDESWNEDQVARAFRDAHLAMEEVASQLADALPEGSKDKLRVQFYTRQMLSALSPSNFLALNPVARQRAIQTEGGSLIDGLENMLEDLERGEGRLDIATNDRDAFTVGEDLGASKGKVVYQNELMQLIQYEPLTETQRKRPMLLVPAWINKFYILDMRPKNSMVRYLLERGHTVFIISWANPTSDHASKGFDSYMKDGPLAALDAIKAATGEDRINVLGFCIGGILVTATLAYLAAKGDKRIASATTLATMIDFTDVGEIGVFIDDNRLKALEVQMADKGYLENHHLQDMFSMIRENDLVWPYHVSNYLMGRKPPAFDLLFWNSDSTRLPAAMVIWYLRKIYLENGLREAGHLSLDGVDIDISKIKTPMFVLATKEDHIAPWTSIYPTTGLVNGKVKFVLGGSGHIAGVINPPSPRNKYGYWTRDDYPEDHEEWLEGADFTEGSWWPAWADWLEKMDRAKQVPARKPGDGDLKPIEDAPGSFVLAR